MAKEKGIVIDKNELVNLIRNIGEEQWSTFSASELYPKGNTHRCDIVADGKEAMLNIYFKKDGSTTIHPIGNNVEVPTLIKGLIEERCTFKNCSQNRSYSKKLPEEWRCTLIEYLKSLDGVEMVEKEIINPSQHQYIFTSRIGDRLTVNIYKNGTLTLQGKPAYLYGEAISLLSYCDSISIEDIVDTVNIFHNIEVNISDVHQELRSLLPNAYENIDNNILKLLSPSISLRSVQMELEDYSCYAFPALRALEGYIKYLFSLKGITIGYNFKDIFQKGKLTPEIIKQINDMNYVSELERLFQYFKNNRHVLFHTEQILIGTTFLEDKKEADDIINQVLNLIETSYIKIEKNLAMYDSKKEVHYG